MKAFREPEFTPVMLCLETQKEVDSIFALLNYTTIQRALDMEGVSPQTALRPFSSKEYNRIRDRLSKIMKT